MGNTEEEERYIQAKIRKERKMETRKDTIVDGEVYVKWKWWKEKVCKKTKI